MQDIEGELLTSFENFIWSTFVLEIQKKNLKENVICSFPEHAENLQEILL